MLQSLPYQKDNVTQLRLHFETRKIWSVRSNPYFKSRFIEIFSLPALDALVGSNPEEVGMDLDPDLVYWCNIRLVNSW